VENDVLMLAREIVEMKRYLFAVSLLILAIVSMSCAKETETYELPVSREAVEKVVRAKGLDWNINDEQSMESRSSFVMKRAGDEPGRMDVGITAVFESIGNDEERFMSALIIYPKDYSITQIQEEQSANLPLLIDMASELYGIGDSAKTVYNEFVKYSEGNNDYESSGLWWDYEVKDAHVLLRMSSLSKEGTSRRCAVFVMNDASYGKYMDGLILNQ